ncbi:MAG: Panacea domain-containing protein [Desulfovibrio sp.]
MRIAYRANARKILEAVIYVASKSKACDFHHILKVLYYADKYHLQKYARPVVGDSYIKMTYGPVGSIAYDVLKSNKFLSADILEAISTSLTTSREGDNPTAKPKREIDISYFSKSDIKCLDAAIKDCEDKSFHELCNSTHKEKAWCEATLNGQMKYELIIDEDITNREKLLQYIEETSPTLSF